MGIKLYIVGLLPISLRNRIDYRNMSLISRFISKQEKKLSRPMNILNFKQHDEKKNKEYK